MKRRGLITFVVLAIAVFAGLALYGDLPELLNQVSSFPVGYWFIVLGLAGANYLFRLVRWHYYLRVLGIKIGVPASAVIFMSGLSMAISPGRVGELAKSYYLKAKLDVPVARAATAVVAERVTDLVSVLLLSVWGLTLVPYGWVVAVVIFVGFAAFLAVVVSPLGTDVLARLPMPQRWRPFLTTSRDSLQLILSPRPLLVALVLSGLAWLAEGIGLWVVLKGLGADASLGEAVSIYAVATLLGAVTMLPGGLVGTEGGMIALLQHIGLTKTPASAATLIIRLCTLWFAVVIGLVALLYVQVYMPKRLPQSAEAMELRPETSGQAD